MGCSYSLGTVIQAVQINDDAKRRGLGAKPPGNF